MGYTGFTKSLVETVLANDNIKAVIDLGAQNDYAQPHLPAPYISEWYKEKDIFYECIDLNGENGAHKMDLGIALPHGYDYNKFAYAQYDLLVDAGTSEHVGKDGAFSWEAIYNCWLNKFHLTKINGWMINENPKTGNWPGHGFNYYSKLFYRQLAGNSDLQIMALTEHPAMHNYTDGWNIACVMKKTGQSFPLLDTFKQFDLHTS